MLPKSKGGICLHRVRAFNQELLAKQVWRLLDAPTGLIAIGKIVPQWEFVGYSVYRQCVRCVDSGRKRAGASQGRDNFTELMTVFP